VTRNAGHTFVWKLENAKEVARSMKTRWIIGLFVWILLLATAGWAQEAPAPLTLEESIQIALERNLQLRSAFEDVKGSEFKTKAARSDFFPLWTGDYSYTRYSDPVALGVRRVAGFGGIETAGQTRDLYNFSTTLGQPLFTGGLLSSTYRLEQLGIDISKSNVEALKRDLILSVREGYFNILRFEKFVDVATQAVKQFEAQLEVAQAFFDVGLVAKNDVLQAEVRLANARQALVSAENNLALSKSSFNTLLRRDINSPLSVVDILGYQPFPLKFDEALGEALLQRPEIRASELSIGQAKEAVKIAQSEYWPTLSLAGNYVRGSDAFYLNGDLRDERWTIEGVATFTIFNWGKTYYKVGESKVRVNQAENSKNQLIDSIVLEVKQAYLEMLRAEKNVGVSEKSIEQAEENLRMNEERYKYQVATATDVLDAVVLLAQARVNYVSALADFNIAKAALDRAMGKMSL
jgi:outer membrane protein TolC